MKYVLDTNVFSALMKGEPAAIDRLARAGRSGVAVEARFARMRMELARMDWSDAVSDAFGRIKAFLERRGRRIEDFDAAIAAHALASGSVLASANVDQMARVPELAVEDWLRPIE